MRLAWERLVQFVNGRVLDEDFVEQLMSRLEVVFGSANKVGRLVKGGCVETVVKGELRVINLNPDDIKEFRFIDAKLDEAVITEISEQLQVPVNQVRAIVGLYVGEPVELEGQEIQGKAAGSLEEDVIPKSVTELGSNLSPSNSVGSTLRLSDRATGQVIHGQPEANQTDDHPAGDDVDTD